MPDSYSELVKRAVNYCASSIASKMEMGFKAIVNSDDNLLITELFLGYCLVEGFLSFCLVIPLNHVFSSDFTLDPLGFMPRIPHLVEQCSNNQTYSQLLLSTDDNDNRVQGEEASVLIFEKIVKKLSAIGLTLFGFCILRLFSKCVEKQELLDHETSDREPSDRVSFVSIEKFFTNVSIAVVGWIFLTQGSELFFKGMSDAMSSDNDLPINRFESQQVSSQGSIEFGETMFGWPQLSIEGTVHIEKLMNPLLAFSLPYKQLIINLMYAAALSFLMASMSYFSSPAFSRCLRNGSPLLNRLKKYCEPYFHYLYVSYIMVSTLLLSVLPFLLPGLITSLLKKYGSLVGNICSDPVAFLYGLGTCEGVLSPVDDSVKQLFSVFPALNDSFIPPSNSDWSQTTVSLKSTMNPGCGSYDVQLREVLNGQPLLCSVNKTVIVEDVSSGLRQSFAYNKFDLISQVYWLLTPVVAMETLDLYPLIEEALLATFFSIVLLSFSFVCCKPSWADTICEKNSDVMNLSSLLNFCLSSSLIICFSIYLYDFFFGAGLSFAENCVQDPDAVMSNIIYFLSCAAFNSKSCHSPKICDGVNALPASSLVSWCAFIINNFPNCYWSISAGMVVSGVFYKLMKYVEMQTRPQGNTLEGALLDESDESDEPDEPGEPDLENSDPPVSGPTEYLPPSSDDDPATTTSSLLAQP